MAVEKAAFFPRGLAVEELLNNTQSSPRDEDDPDHPETLREQQSGLRRPTIQHQYEPDSLSQQ